ncbi:hypothetical protein L7F22_034286 [Adiantum nelumboides]|nr:hypothetical protein [Adiantum nelumboides]
MLAACCSWADRWVPTNSEEPNPGVLVATLTRLPSEHWTAYLCNTLSRADLLVAAGQAEIGRKPGSDNVLEREGYALAAGLALGLVTLGKGKSAWGLADLSIEERLLHYMSGGTEPGEGRHSGHDALSGNPSANAPRNLDDLYQNNGQMRCRTDQGNHDLPDGPLCQ